MTCLAVGMLKKAPCINMTLHIPSGFRAISVDWIRHNQVSQSNIFSEFIFTSYSIKETMEKDMVDQLSPI